MCRALLLFAVLLALLTPSSARASSSIRYGVQDDAWLQWGPGTLQQRFTKLNALGVDVVRVTVDWRATEPRRGSYRWAMPDELLNGLHAHGIAPLVTLYGSPGWANGGRTENWAPTSGSTFAAFAAAIAKRYPFVHLWTVWNEPNQVRWLRPTTPTVYVQRLLNPAYAAIHRVSPASKVAGGVTAPRGSSGGVSPIAWVTGLAKAHAHLDAYAHNPYPLEPNETPTSGGCGHCTTVTMATIGKLIDLVHRDFGTRVRIWLTEYGYQTNPPDKFLGVSYAKQARYIAQAALRAYLLPRVDILIQYLVEDEPNADRWQSGLFSAHDIAKPAYEAFRFPLAQRARVGLRTTLWGQVRPGGTETYKLLQERHGHWYAVGGVMRTSGRGYFTRVVRAAAGARYRVWVPSQHTYSAILTVT